MTDRIHTPAIAKPSAIDWEVVKAKLKASEIAIEEIFAADGAKAKKVFADRASRMAARLRDTAQIDTITVMTFQLGEERYALPLANLAEILPLEGLTQVPGAPDELKGILSVRGEIRCVIDLAKVLGLTLPEDDESRGYILLLREDGFELGLSVTQVRQVETIDRATLVNQDSIGASMIGHYIKGIGEKNLIFLNLTNVLNHPVFRGVG